MTSFTRYAAAVAAALCLSFAAPAMAQVHSVANAGTTGTATGQVAKVTGATSTAVRVGTADTTWNGIVVGETATTATTGSALLQVGGQASCSFDGATTGGDFVQISSTTAGDCHDAGATYPTSGSQIIGQVLSTNGSAGSYVINVFSPGISATSGGSGSPLSVVALTDASSLTVAAPTGIGTAYTLTMTGNSPYTLNNPASMTAGSALDFILTQDATGGRTIATYGSQYSFPAGTPVLNPAANSVSALSCIAKDTTHAVCFGGTMLGSQLTGTTTSDNASTGNVGEDIKSTISSGSAVSLTTATTANITSISLTAGDWDVCGAANYVAGSTTVTTFLDAGINATSATLPTAPYGYAQTNQSLALTGNILPSLTIPCIRESLASTTTIYLTTQGSFVTSTLTAYGYIEARRRR